MKSRTEHELGDLLRDTISGFEGVVVCKSFWLNGCIRLTLQPKKINEKTNLPVENQTFDVEQLEVVMPKLHEVLSPTGGPTDEPRQHSGPRRT